ncbi:MAG: PhoH-like ATPase [Deferribacteres bacterium]|nr:PhoH-like ATPase [Deferribacteres bacterium]
MRRKIFILDTNVLMYSPSCLDTFDNNYIVIPATCFEELDKFKSSYELKGFYAREFLRNFEKLRSGQNILTVIKLESGGKVFVRYLSQGIRLPVEFGKDSSDNNILKTAIQTEREFNKKVVLVTKDTNLRIKADI